jgi:hypothetical protein
MQEPEYNVEDEEDRDYGNIWDDVRYSPKSRRPRRVRRSRRIAISLYQLAVCCTKLKVDCPLGKGRPALYTTSLELQLIGNASGVN